MCAVCERERLRASHRSKVAPYIVGSDRTSSACPQLITIVCATASATRYLQRCHECVYVAGVLHTKSTRGGTTMSRRHPFWVLVRAAALALVLALVLGTSPALAARDRKPPTKPANL